VSCPQSPKPNSFFHSNLSLDAELAWIAGFIDGEGTVIVYEHRYPSGYRVLKGRVSAECTEKELLEVIYKRFGGQLRQRKRYDDANKYGIKSRKPLWVWEADCLQAYKVCKSILPYFKSSRKREACEEVIKLYESRYLHRH